VEYLGVKHGETRPLKDQTGGEKQSWEKKEASF